MMEAIEELYTHGMSKAARAFHIQCKVELKRITNPAVLDEYEATLYSLSFDGPEEDALVVTKEVYVVSRPDSYEQAVGGLLTLVQQELDRYKESLLEELKAVTDKHRSTVRGARQKNKE